MSKSKKPLSNKTTTPGGHGKKVVKKATKTKAQPAKQEAINKVVRRKIVYDEVGVQLHTADTEEGELSVEQGKGLLGWMEESENREFGEDYLFKLPTIGKEKGKKIRCLNNLTNRPFRLGLARKWMSEILRKKWKMNGESMIIDEYGMLQSCQHRLIALVMAEYTRAADPTKWSKYWRVPITIPALIVTGVDSSPETIDTIDQGLKRNHGDVYYRERKFEEVGDREQAKMSRTLSYAVRLVWLRSGGMTVSAAPHFPITESKEFSNNHTRLLECVEHIWALEGGKKLKNISTYLSMGYASGLMYMMGAAATEHTTYDGVRSEEGIDWLLWENAERFWEIFCIKDGPLEVLRKKLINMSAGGAQGRDLICGTVIKAWNTWSDNPEKVLTDEDIEVTTSEDEDSGLILVSETPRIGGIDVEREQGEDA